MADKILLSKMCWWIWGYQKFCVKSLHLDLFMHGNCVFAQFFLCKNAESLASWQVLSFTTQFFYGVFDLSENFILRMAG